MLRLALVLASLAVAVPARADGATQTVLGGRFEVRGSPGGDPSRRRVGLFAREADTLDTVVGDPTVGGATLRVIARGPAREYDETFALPAAGWRATLTRHDWPVFKGFRYTNALTGGAVRTVVVKRSGFHSREGTPPPEEPLGPGVFQLKVTLVGRDGPIAALPPDPGTEGGVVLTLGGGDAYCVAFGAAAGGQVLADTAVRFAIRRPTAEGCPGGAP
jgi:hypothetical protein